MFSDIDLSQLIFKKTPAAWHPYIKLARLDRPVGIWLLLLPCLWGIVLAEGGIDYVLSLQTAETVALFVLGAVLMRSAGCIINDLWDMNLDAAVERTKTRPLAAGEISMANALRFLFALLGAALLVLIMLPHTAIVLSLGLVFAYPYMKRVTWMPQLFLGLTFNWGALMGWAAVLDEISAPAVLLYIAGIFWTLGYDTIYAHQDKQDDELVGIKSTARLFGEKSKLFVGVFYFIAVVFLVMAKYTGTFGILTPLLAAAPAAHAGWQLWKWDMNDPASCNKVFRSNTVFGLLVLLMLAF
jgi:4-hydroxybenzoate polyprenyltransferase